MYIGKAALLSGTTIKTIRHYEAIGLLPTPVRHGRYRVYDPRTVARLKFIKCAQQLGFKLKEMQGILQGQDDFELPWSVAAQAIAAKKQQVMAQISSLQLMYAGLDAFEAELQTASHRCEAATGG
ncbi:MerR family transcriptional regulator [Pseudomonas parafulva]|uniref:MerR family transcriptional regulator n=1 Tax=Pseudomonas parafulva TaxID=157782 RepID=UPI00042515AA|nr:MerR family transcriptional regulator [Pseudomonas parafulva]